MTKFVIFDLDNTLCDFNAGLARARLRIGLILREAGIPADPFWDSFMEIEPAMQCAMVDGFLSSNECLWRTFYETCSRFIGCVGVLPDVMTRIFHEETVLRLRLFDDVEAAVLALRDLGVRVAVYAEGDSASQREKFRALGLHAFVDPRLFYISEEIGAQKPSTNVFRHILADAGVSPGDALVVGDSVEDDVWAGELAGIRSILLDRSGRAGASYLGERLSSLSGIADVLGKKAGDTDSGPEPSVSGVSGVFPQRVEDAWRFIYGE